MTHKRRQTHLFTPTARGIDMERWSAPAVAVLLLLAIPAFWSSYLVDPVGLGTRYTHIHATTATAWFLLLLIQPVLLRTGRRTLHRFVGRVGWVLGPLVLVGIALGAHSLLHRLAPDQPPLARYVLYLQVSLGLVFGTIWLLGMGLRGDRKTHGRLMAATGLTFVDPVLARSIPSIPGVSAQVITFTAVNVILVWLIWNERHARRGRWVFPLVLLLFLALELPLALGITESALWTGFAEWYHGLPLT